MIRNCTLLGKNNTKKRSQAIRNKAGSDPDKSRKGQFVAHVRSVHHEKGLFSLFSPSLCRVHALLTLKGKLWARGRALMHSELTLQGLFIFAGERGCFHNSPRAERKEAALLPTSWTSRCKRTVSTSTLAHSFKSSTSLTPL